MKYLVTGGAGFIGSALVRRLRDAHEVTVLDDFSRGRPDRVPPGVNILRGDIRDLAAVERALQGQDAVIHLAYIQGTQTFYAEPRKVWDVGARGMLNLLDACRLCGVSEMMLFSSSEVYQNAPMVPTPETVPLSVPDPLNARYSYGGGKIACEQMALAWQRTGVLDRLIIVRPHNIYGPDMGREHVIPEFCLRMNGLLSDGEWLNQHGGEPLPFPIQGSGTETRSFCYIDDCIAQLGLLLDRAPSGIWNVGTMDEHPIAGVAADVAACYGREIRIIPGALAKGSPIRRLPDIGKIQGLGWGHGTPWPTGLAATVDWYRAHG